MAFGPNGCLMRGALPCPVGCWASSPASTHRRRQRRYNHPLESLKISPDIDKYPFGAKIPSSWERLCGRDEHFDGRREKKKFCNIGRVRGGQAWLRLGRRVSIPFYFSWSTRVSAPENPPPCSERQVHHGKQQGSKDETHPWEIGPCTHVEALRPLEHGCSPRLRCLQKVRCCEVRAYCAKRPAPPSPLQ